tara:strand:+ start:600 stop:869 length:270 start_codon:yes stop_codon:yes gene_type:complete
MDLNLKTGKARRILRLTPIGLRIVIREFFSGAPDSWQSKRSFNHTGGSFDTASGYGDEWYDHYDEYDYSTSDDGDDDDGDDAGDDGGDD